MTQQIGILASENSWYYQKLASAAEKLDIQVMQIDFGSLAMNLDLACSADISAHDQIQCMPPIETAIVRTMPTGSLEQVIFRMDTLRGWQSRGIHVVNSPVCLETCIDKVLTLKQLEDDKIPFPRTFACQTSGQAMQAFEALGHDVVVKPIFGGEGRGIIRICEAEMAYRIFSSLEKTQSVIYCQAFIQEIAKEMRLLFIGDKLFSILKTNPHSWVKNAARGGSADVYTPTAEEIELGMAACHSIGGEVVGVDILQDREGNYWVLEVNAVPGWKQIEQVLDTDIAREVILYTNSAAPPPSISTP